MEKSRKQAIVFGLEVIAMAILYIILDTAGIYKYIAVIVIGSILLLVNRNRINLNVLKEDGHLLLPVILYCGIGLCLSAFGGNQTFWTLKTVAFWTIPPLFSMLLCTAYYKNRARMVDMQFYGAALGYLMTKGHYILLVGEWESTFAFVFGLFALYYVWRHKWGQVVIAIVMMHFANKRIAVLAVLLCLCLMVFMKLVKYSKKWIYILWGMLIAVVGVYLYAIFSGAFAIFCEKMHINTMTRIDIYTQIVERVPGFRPWGQGLGAANELLSQMFNPEFVNRWYQNPHNDFLKLYIELGAVGLLLLMVSFFVVLWISGRELENRALSQLFITFAYFMMLMTTDNVSIYILFLVPMYSVCLALMGEKKDR